MKANTVKAFNKRRFRLMLNIYAHIFLFKKKASRRFFREKELEKILRKYPKLVTFEA